MGRDSFVIKRKGNGRELGARTAVLIDAANLRTGGAVQAAASFIDELADIRSDSGLCGRYPWLNQVRVEASSAVTANLSHGTGQRLSVHRRERSWKQLAAWRSGQGNFEVSFVLFGPEYGRRRSRRRIIGFADGLVALPAPAGVRFAVGERLRRIVRRKIWRLSLKTAACVVVESELVRAHLAPLVGRCKESIEIVPNACNGVFDCPEKWRPIEIPSDGLSSDTKMLSYVARAYPHKNHKFLAFVHEVLQRQHALDVRFIVTMTNSEWLRTTEEFRRATVNVGPIEIAQAPNLYKASHGAVFPSLLESFSVTPLEALRMDKPLFASDRDFVRNVCGDAAIYIDPMDPDSTAKVIAGALADRALLDRHAQRGRDVMASLPDARGRALEYVEMIDSQVRKGRGDSVWSEAPS